VIWRVTLGGAILSDAEQPNELSSVFSTLKRDFNSGGVFFRFTGSNSLSLKFPGSGRDTLQAAWLASGVDARVSIVIENRSDEFADWVQVYTGYSDMSTRVYDSLFFSVDFEEVSLLNTIQSNLKTKVDIDSSVDINGNAITPLAYDVMAFPAFNLVTSAGGAYQIFSYSSLTGFPNSESLDLIADEVIFTGDLSAYDELAPEATATVIKYGGRIRALPQATDYDVDIALTMEANYDIDTGTFTGNAVTKLIRKNLSTGTETAVDTNTYDLSGGTLIGQSISFTDSQTISNVGYEWFLQIEDNSITGNDGAAIMTWGSNNIVLSLATTYGATVTNANCVKLFYSIDKNLEIVTGEQSLLVSDYLDAGGALEQVIETNGYQLRALDRPINGSLSDRMKALKSVFGVGWGMEVGYIGSELNTVRVEPWDYFFADTELLVIDDLEIDSYSEEYASELEFSSIRVGYNKYSDDEEFSNVESIKDHCTEVSYKAPIQNLNGEPLDLTTNYIASPALIEITRRKQFLLNTDKAWKYDSDLFLIDCSDYLGLSPRDATNILTSNIGDIYYNLLLNPRFNFFNNYFLINSIMYGKALTEEYFNQDFKINPSGKIGYATAFGTPDFGDIRTFASVSSVPTNNANLPANDVRSGDSLFEPTKVMFKAGLSASQVNTLVLAHRNGLSSGNYGYISLVNPDGDDVSGWILELNYSPVDKIGEFSLLKKQLGWALVGNSFSLTNSRAYIAALDENTIALVVDPTDELRTYTFDGTNWTLTGTPLALGIWANWASITALSSTRIAYIDTIQKDLRAYDWNGSTWSLVGSELNISLDNPSIASMDSSTIAFVDITNEELRTYSFNGSTWSLDGTALALGTITTTYLAGLDSTTIALLGDSELKTYSWSGTDWVQLGNTFTMPATWGSSSMALLSTNKIALLDSGSNLLQQYKWDGTNWTKFGKDKTIGGGQPSITSLSSNSIAYIDTTDDELRKYQYT
jgi:hypothetical protein